MILQRYIKKVLQGSYGKLYQFLELDSITGEERTVNSFDSRMLQELAQEAPPEILYINSKRGADASGYYLGEKFVVQKGSKFAASTSPKCPQRYIKLREGLVLDGILVPLHNQLLLMQDTEFESPMAAMGTVIGGWAKGLQGWKEAGRR